MLSGIFTPTEAAVVAAIYALVLTSIFYRSLDLRGFMKICADTVKESSMILVIVGASSLYGYLLIKSQIPTYLMNKVFTFSQNPVVILFLINLFLLIIGCFMECNAAIMILTPILVPMCQAVGIDSVHLGVIMVLNLMIGLLTPPIGMCLFTTARVANITLDKMIKEVMPFYIPLVIVLLMVTYIPDLVLFLPRLVL